MADGQRRAVVLGADLDGLAAAATLAGGGAEVTVVDGAPQTGGIAAAVPLADGHVVPGLLHDPGLLRRGLLATALGEHDVSWRADRGALHVVAEGDVRTALSRDAGGTGADAAAYERWRASIDRLTHVVADLLDSPPPMTEQLGWRDALGLARRGWALRRLGKRDLHELLRIANLPAHDWLGEWFADPALRAGLCAPALCGTVVGPRAAGTTALLLLREAARGDEPVGGPAAVCAALEQRCRTLGVRFLLEAEAARITTVAGSTPAVAGVALRDGTELAAPLVLSALDPQHTLLDLLPAGLLPRPVETELHHLRARGSSAVLLLALRGDLDRLPGDVHRFVTATDPETLERAADALKYGELCAAPWLDVRLWHRSDPGCAPAGAGTLSVHVHGISHALRGGWDDAARADLRRRIVAALDAAVPGTTTLVHAEQLLTPADLETRYGLRGGHLYRGELALDQLLLQRPALALSRYATPVAGLYSCGAGSHPGGPFAGGAGVLGARAALGDS